MKYFKIFSTLLLCSFVSLYSCNDSTKTSKENATTSDSKEVKDASTETKKATPKLKEPAQNASGVWHYTCRIGCPGGAGIADKCKTCGNILIHNTVYHNGANPTNTNSDVQFSTPPATTPTPEPSQNSAGVWHYTCSKGCAGGAGSAIACATCNETLAHNSAYH